MGLIAAVIVSALAILSFAAATQVTLHSTGTTFVLGNVSYFAPPSPVSRIGFFGLPELLSLVGSSTGSLVPFSVIPTSESDFDDSALDVVAKAWSASDDVWSTSFMTGLYIKYNGTGHKPSVSLSSSAKSKYAVKFLTSSSSYSGGIALTNSLPSGPYLLEPATGNIFEVYRLYNDEQQSFVYGTVPNGNGGFQVASAKTSGAATESIPVPSRLYFTPTAEKPFAGYRLGVKDIYDVQGLHTGCGNRAYWALYPPKTQTAPAVQRLLDGGMVLVGKTKSSQFANGEVATDDWVDLHAPYNPRGDGYQDGSSSSTGSGTAMAAYSWLDFAIGSDTGGSMRGPSGANGVFGNRPSHGAISTDDVMPLSPELDTLGIFSRDAKLWTQAGHWWYQNFTSYSQYPKKILFPVDSFGSSYLAEPPAPGTVGATFNAFITQLEGFLGTTRTEINLTTMWDSTKPSNVSSTLREFLNTTYPTLITTDQIALLAEPFFRDYAAATGGRKPFIDPAPLTRWDYGWSLPASAHNEAIVEKTTFMDWFQKEIVPGGVPDTCSDAIFLYPQSSGGTTYRNAYPGPPTTPFGFSSGRIAVFAETPDMVVPVGEAAYNSTITGQIEYLPVTLSFITAKNCDLMLFNLFAALQDADVIKPVVTGSRVFEVPPTTYIS
ncbi:uncharacterized protein FIBRA_01241 [Fibroporia radiculosa]|uniref:Uncharacterized protein n=1 Tax=Fibroporia radiculosa TaxID=599839 RepID=J4I8D6_9APHY|nr:uncharacterized protein FIBRA_01241 [Fibroporia radiculosa]CCL99226.1 predicted protein [Fibroporia radiculosa]